MLYKKEYIENNKKLKEENKRLKEMIKEVLEYLDNSNMSWIDKNEIAVRLKDSDKE